MSSLKFPKQIEGRGKPKILKGCRTASYSNVADKVCDDLCQLFFPHTCACTHTFVNYFPLIDAHSLFLSRKRGRQRMCWFVVSSFILMHFKSLFPHTHTRLRTRNASLFLTLSLFLYFYSHTQTHTLSFPSGVPWAHCFIKYAMCTWTLTQTIFLISPYSSDIMGN